VWTEDVQANNEDVQANTEDVMSDDLFSFVF
jgi:hypothetical protein